MMRVTALLLCSWSCAALTLQTEANPIRKVVTLLQDMQKEIEAEGEKEKGLYDKFMCYCTASGVSRVHSGIASVNLFEFSMTAFCEVYVDQRRHTMGFMGFVNDGDKNSSGHREKTDRSSMKGFEMRGSARRWQYRRYVEVG